MQTLTKIELTPEEAQLFVKFQKRYAFIEIMESIGAFDIKSGSVKLSFDKLGAIGSIEVLKHYHP